MEGFTGAVRSFSGHPHWSHRGVWKRVFACLAEDLDHEYAMIDSTLARAHQHSAGANGGIGQRNASGGQKVDCPRTCMPSAMRSVIPQASI